MHRTKLAYIAFFIVCAVLLSGCRKKASEEIDFGTVENSVYKNKYFGLSVTIPSDWSIQDQESRQRIMDTGAKALAGDDKNMKAMLKASQLQTVNLLTVMKYPLGSPVTYNPSIICVAERVSHMPGIKRGKDYLFHTRKFLESGQMSVSFPREISTEKLGDTEFDVLYVELPVSGIKVQKKYYTIIMKGYALGLIESYTNAEEESSLDNILRSVTFK